MAVQDERVRLILELLGKGEFQQASVETKKLKDELQQLDHVAKREVSQGMRNAGLSVLYLSQTLEDAQYGLRGILNNIPGLVMAMGGGPGLAGVISVAAVGLNSLNEHFKIWENLTKGDATETEAERMERLAKATKLTAEETKQLNEYKEKQAALARVEAIRSQGEEDIAAGVRKRISPFKGSEVAAELEAAINDFHRRVNAGMGPAFLARQAQAAPGQAAVLLSQALQGQQGAFGNILDLVQRRESPIARALRGDPQIDPMFREREAKELFQRRVEEERRKQAESRELGKALTEQGARFEREGTERAMAEAERDKEEAEREAEHAQKEAERKDRQRIADIARDPEAMARAQQLLMGAGGPGAGVHAVHAIKGQLGVELGISAADAYQVAMEALTALIQQMRQENLRMRRISDQTAAWARHAMWEAGAMPMTGQNNGRP